MDSYIHNAFQDGRYRLICQYGGLSARELEALLQGNAVVAYGIPKTQSFEGTWHFKLYLADETELVFAAKCTGVGGWDEVGSLSIDLESSVTTLTPDWLTKRAIGPFGIERFSMLVYEEENVYAEAGICLFSDTGEKIMILAAVPPGAVSVSIPDADTDLKPEFRLAEYDYRAAVVV